MSVFSNEEADFAGIACTVELPDGNKTMHIFEHSTAHELKVLFLQNDQDLDKFYVIIRYALGHIEELQDDEEFGDRLCLCEKVCILQKGLSITATKGVSESLSPSKERNLCKQNDGSVKEQWDTCEKNPKHHGFVPWLQYLSANSLSDEVHIKYIKAIGELTVLIRINFKNQDKSLSLGSGLVVYDVEETKENKCMCSKCLPLKVKPTAWKVFVVTATHVFLDEQNVGSFIAELFYHDLTDRKSVKKLYGSGICERRILGDCCVVECCTCDGSLSEEIRKLLHIQNEQFPKLPQIIQSSTVVISHPHGMPKFISFGEFVGEDFKNDTMFRLSSWKYKTPTCKGSSGAPVLYMNNQFKARGSRFLVTHLHLHSRANPSGSFSSISCQPKLHRNSSYGSKQETQASLFLTNGNTTKHVFHQSELSERSSRPEGDFPQWKKHQKLENCIPVSTLKFDNLPEKYKNYDLLNFIKAMSDILCSVRVRSISKERPAFYPDTNETYPTSKEINTVEHFGSGYLLFNCTQNISNMKYCPCHECHPMENKEKEFGIVYVRTANSVVFDDFEAKQSEVTFETSSFGRLTMNGVRVISNDVKQDYSIIMCVTHRVEVCQHFNSLRENLHKLDKKIRSQYNNEEHKLSIMVSYSCESEEKMVTFGELTGKKCCEFDKDIDLESYTYSNPPGSGSSGAPVVILGQVEPRIMEHFITCHIHSDALEECNKSSYVIDSLLPCSNNN
ncbi:unnamed protein product [Lymnaea stagnalis]|uniref:Uncharacterized protein n=1 Tax=Lymnaea stagnalis TaxID=6523 RepID=A0AAV2HSY3_LYMST